MGDAMFTTTRGAVCPCKPSNSKLDRRWATNIRNQCGVLVGGHSVRDTTYTGSDVNYFKENTQVLHGPYFLTSYGIPLILTDLYNLVCLYGGRAPGIRSLLQKLKYAPNGRQFSRSDFQHRVDNRHKSIHHQRTALYWVQSALPVAFRRGPSA